MYVRSLLAPMEWLLMQAIDVPMEQMLIDTVKRFVEIGAVKA
jgi:hypothetical protein